MQCVAQVVTALKEREELEDRRLRAAFVLRISDSHRNAVEMFSDKASKTYFLKVISHTSFFHMRFDFDQVEDVVSFLHARLATPQSRNVVETPLRVQHMGGTRRVFASDLANLLKDLLQEI
ncbi:MAG: uncharacterized protein KVP18_004112 [Porospora cf. gigantea A]|uniref:uncharacterized protein n=1 Tax=Porospora cf. gigantea A TaxID=2853593 RepID=UPI0035595854|nr:MAG: hypothetical protein KVP18_004112 [Porospora cf. gigantea A]